MYVFPLGNNWKKINGVVEFVYVSINKLIAVDLSWWTLCSYVFGLTVFTTILFATLQISKKDLICEIEKYNEYRKLKDSMFFPFYLVDVLNRILVLHQD